MRLSVRNERAGRPLPSRLTQPHSGRSFEPRDGRRSPKTNKPGTTATSEDESTRTEAEVKTPKRRGRPPNPERRDAIRNAINKHGDQWRDHLNEIFAELDGQEVLLGDFQAGRLISAKATAQRHRNGTISTSPKGSSGTRSSTCFASTLDGMMELIPRGGFSSNSFQLIPHNRFNPKWLDAHQSVSELSHKESSL